MIFLLLLLFAASPAGVAAAEPRAQGGLAAYEQGDFSLALEQFQGRVALEPREAIHYYNLGTTLFRLKQLAQAGEAFQRALSLDPTLSAARHNLQVVREEQARQEQGEKQQKQQEKGEQGEKGQEQQQEQEEKGQGKEGEGKEEKEEPPRGQEPSEGDKEQGRQAEEAEESGQEQGAGGEQAPREGEESGPDQGGEGAPQGQHGSKPAAADEGADHDGARGGEKVRDIFSLERELQELRRNRLRRQGSKGGKNW